MTSEITFSSLQARPDAMQALFKAIEDDWKSRVPLQPILPYLTHIESLISSEKIKGVILFKAGEPMSAGWIEMAYGGYGVATFYSKSDAEKPLIVIQMVQSGLLTNTTFELVSLQPGFEFHDALGMLGLKEKHRYKMLVSLEDPLPVPDSSDAYQLDLLTEEDMLWFDDFCLAAFPPEDPYSDYVYHDSPYQKKLIYYQTVADNSFKLLRDGKPVAVCQSMEMAGWGYPKIGWIRMIAVLPEFARQGLGKQLLIRCLNGFYERGIRQIGLGVTSTNKPALTLYESLGFQVMEEFNEFVGPRSDTLSRKSL